MKIKNATLILHFLLIFVFCFSSTALTEKEAHDAYIKADRAADKANLAWAEADTKTDTAEALYGMSNDAVVLLQSALALKKSESSSKLSEGANTLYNGIKAIGLDPVDMASDVTAAVLEGLKSGWDWFMIRKEKKKVEKALADAQAKNAEFLTNYNSKKEISDALLTEWKKLEAKEDEAWVAWQALIPLTYKLEPKDGNKTTFVGNRHIAVLTLNKVYSWADWHLKSPNETGIGTRKKIEMGQGKDQTSELWIKPDLPGEYLITTKAKIDGTDKIITDSYTLTVLPKEEQYKVSFNYNDDLVPIYSTHRGWITTKSPIKNAYWYLMGHSRDNNTRIFLGWDRVNGGMRSDITFTPDSDIKPDTYKVLTVIRFEGEEKKIVTHEYIIEVTE